MDPPEPLAGGDYTYDEDNPSKTFRDTFMYTCLIARLFPGTDQPYDHVVTSECQWNKTWTVVNVIIEKKKLFLLLVYQSVGRSQRINQKKYESKTYKYYYMF